MLFGVCVNKPLGEKLMNRDRELMENAWVFASGEMRTARFVPPTGADG